MVILVPTIAVATFVVIVMLILIERWFDIIVYIMIQILVYLLEDFQKEKLLKKVRKRAGL